MEIATGGAQNGEGIAGEGGRWAWTNGVGAGMTDTGKDEDWCSGNLAMAGAGSAGWAAEAGSGHGKTVAIRGMAATRDNPSHGNSNALSSGNGNNLSGLASGRCDRTWAGRGKDRMAGTAGAIDGAAGQDGFGAGVMPVGNR